MFKDLHLSISFSRDTVNLLDSLLGKSLENHLNIKNIISLFVHVEVNKIHRVCVKNRNIDIKKIMCGMDEPQHDS